MHRYFLRGAHIRVVGLVTRKDLNGLEGVLVDYDTASSRWKVILENQHGVSLHPDNLVSVGSLTSRKVVFKLGDRIRVTRLIKRCELNGAEGVLHEWDAVNMRWKVVLHDGFGLSLCEGNLELLPVDRSEDNTSASTLQRGMTVRIVGLQSRVDLNGTIGRLVEYDNMGKRWNVLLEDEAGLSIRPQNLEPHETEAASNCRDLASELDTRNEDAISAFTAGDLVQVVGLAVRPELNGLLGHLLEYDLVGHRWKVVLNDGRGLKLRQENLQVASTFGSESSPLQKDEMPQPASAKLAEESPKIATSEDLKPGIRVCIQGLTARSDLNGSHGTLLKYSESESRWHVRLDDGSGKKLKALNLHPDVPAIERPNVNDDGRSHQNRHAATSMEQRDQLSYRFHQFLKTGERLCIPSKTLGVPRASEAAASKVELEKLRIGSTAALVGIVSRPELNGMRCTLLRFDIEIQRWEVFLCDGTFKMVRRGNLQLA